MFSHKRLHPAAVLEYLIKNLWSLLQIFLANSVIIATSPLDQKWIIGLGIILLITYIGFAILSWWRFSYSIYNDELRIEHGILTRKKTHIPIERIQSIEVTAGIVQRIFGLVKLEVQTAGGTKQAEASLSAITMEQANELQKQLKISFSNKIVVKDAPITVTLQRKLTTKELIIAASTSNGLGVVLLGGLAFFSQIDQFIPQQQIYNQIIQILTSYDGQGLIIWIAGVLIVLILAWIVSIIGTIISLGGFVLNRYEDHLHAQWGLLEKRQVNIPLKRIQAVKIVEGVLRRPFGLATVYVVSAGYGNKSGSDAVIFPLIPKKEIDSFLNTFLPEFKLIQEFNPVSKKAKPRYLMYLTVPVLLIALPISLFVNYGFLSLLLPILALFVGYSQYKNAGWLLTDDQLIVRTQSLGIITTIVKKPRVQSFSLIQTPLQMRSNLKSFSLKIASSFGGTKIGINGIESENGNVILDWISPEK